MIGGRLFLWLVLTAGMLGTAGVVVWWNFHSTMIIRRARVHRGSQVVSTRFGTIEYAMVGHGAPVLAVHGAAGGFDQAISVANRYVAAGYRLIAPSRFGYLRSSSPSDPSPENQADAFAVLLDELQIQSVAVVGVSAGALSTLQFAVRHPDRCRSLVVIVPAASSVLAGQGPMPEQGPIAQKITAVLVKSDFLYWLGLTVARGRMIRSVLATDPSVMASASQDERQRALDILWNVLPISERSQGLLNDSRFVSAPQSIVVEKIKAPTLVVSVEDDYYRTLAPARVIAARIPGARLVTYATGGHVWVGHDAEVFAAVDTFLRRN